MTEIALPGPARVGQATAVEQSRAVAEVHAAIVVAQQCPRDVQAAIAQMRQSCAMPALAERAFFRFSRGGGQVSGPSVHLARELARCWGNIQYGIAELSRDDDHGQSEMLAYAWDVQTNARSSTAFIVPHKRDKRGGPERLTDMRDIYENNANAGARRVRECIFAVLPPWLVEEAKERCRKTTVDGPVDESGKPLKALPQRIADVLAAFAELGVTEEDVVRKLGRPSSRWTAFDVADLVVIGRSMKNGETTREAEFPAEVVTAAEIAAATPARSELARQPEPREPGSTDTGVFHDRGHTQPGSTDRRDAWHPDCPLCQDDEDHQAGATHYYSHTEHDADCTFCVREQAWKAAQPTEENRPHPTPPPSPPGTSAAARSSTSTTRTA